MKFRIKFFSRPVSVSATATAIGVVRSELVKEHVHKGFVAELLNIVHFDEGGGSFVKRHCWDTTCAEGGASVGMGRVA